MKKLVSLAASVLLALSFVSCGEKIDSSGWLSNYDDAKKIAREENKRLFLFFSGDDFDEISRTLKENVFNTEDFLKVYTEKYVLLNLDYSNSRYDSEQSELTADLKVFEKYNPKALPSFIIASKEGYYITTIALDANADLDTVRITFDEAEPAISEFESKVERTKTGSKEERLAAINEIFNETDPGLVYHLSDLNKLYLSLDKDNSTGECAKHLSALVYARANDFLLEGKAEKASQEFEKLAKNKFLSDSEKQMSLYTAGYLLASSGSKDLKKIQAYLQKAIDIDPESEEAQNIKAVLTQVQMMIDGEGDELPENYDVPNAPDNTDSPVAEAPSEQNASDSPLSENSATSSVSTQD